MTVNHRFNSIRPQKTCKGKTSYFTRLYQKEYQVFPLHFRDYALQSQAWDNTQVNVLCKSARVLLKLDGNIYRFFCFVFTGESLPHRSNHFSSTFSRDSQQLLDRRHVFAKFESETEPLNIELDRNFINIISTETYSTCCQKLYGQSTASEETDADLLLSNQPAVITPSHRHFPPHTHRIHQEGAGLLFP